jgi:hypothetical protein
MNSSSTVMDKETEKAVVMTEAYWEQQICLDEK